MKSRLFIGSALVLIVAALLAVDAYGRTRLAIAALLGLLSLLGWFELALLTGVTSRNRGGGRMLASVGFLAALYFVALNVWFARGAGGAFLGVADTYGGGLLLGLAATLLGSFAASVFHSEHAAAFRALEANVLAVLLLGLFFSFALVLYHQPSGGLVGLVYFLGIKGNDISAYFIGRAVGRRRILKVSPKKTLEGCVAAVIFSVFWFVTVGWLWPDIFFPWPGAIAAGIILSITAQIGDLSASLIKRALKVKDSGRLLPEFGGVLDMIDSMLFTGVVFWFLLDILR